MTYIKLSNDMSLAVTVADSIYRGDNMSSCITFLIPSSIMNIDTATLFLSYIRADGEPDMVILKRSSDYNQNYYQYTLPVTCQMTRYAGTVCMWLQIMNGDVDNPTVAKSGECTIKIRESRSMDDLMCDHQLHAMYQLKKKVDELSGADDGTGGDDSGDYWEDM